MESIKVYLHDIKNIPLLSPKEELELAKKVKKGNKKAREKMIRSNLRLVINIAKRYNYFGVPLVDLIEEGNIGLMHAVDKFNHRKGFRFSTYAAWWIKQGITRSIIEQGKLIRIPVYMNEAIAKYKRTKELLSQKLKRKPYTKEVAKKLRLPISKVRELDKWITKTLSLETPIGEDDTGQVKDIIEDENLASPNEEIKHFFDKERAVDLLQIMNKRERVILSSRFGLTDGRLHTLAEIAKKLRVSRERIRQIEEVALKKLRRFIEKQKEEQEEEL